MRPESRKADKRSYYSSLFVTFLAKISFSLIKLGKKYPLHGG
ncbi:hypothetical protein PROVRUST_07758 [Providencia rustigianii DSM 4541]|uniref:Uncharacterized protein n=1 Tax=Providencia rustigianii DSM 4541 TaxID=500637 RepID=D1P692_9GAMM|nr:hypothetical protein PROVRUST_07758 [Providencia rustigianii DSM 4541]